ncbi:hypothetical protein PENTCL1PPCAC_5483, partial [Pristionchus entomophagus]
SSAPALVMTSTFIISAEESNDQVHRDNHITHMPSRDEYSLRDDLRDVIDSVSRQIDANIVQNLSEWPLFTAHITKTSMISRRAIA